MDNSQILTKEIAEQYLKDPRPMELQEFTFIEDAAAGSLAGDGEVLFLDGLINLSDAAAEALAQHNGHLVLSGLESLSLGATKALAKHKGPSLFLTGLTSLSDAAAETLAQHIGRLNLGGLDGLSLEAAKALAEHKGDLCLGLTSLSDAAAEALARHQGELDLSMLMSLSDAAAEALAKHSDVCLNDTVERIVEDARARIAGSKIKPFGRGKILTKEIAEQFLEDNGSVDLGEFDSLENSAAEVLAGYHDGELYLNGLMSLSKSSAQHLSFPEGFLHLNGLTNLSLAAGKALGERQYALNLNGLKNLSNELAESLVQNQQILCLNGLTSVNDFVAKVLSSHGGGDGALFLDGIEIINDAAAGQLANYDGCLSMNGLTRLDDSPGHLALVEKLIMRDDVSPDHVFSFDKLPSLNEAVALKLIKYNGEISLKGLTGLNDKAAEILAKHKYPIYISAAAEEAFTAARERGQTR